MADDDAERAILEMKDRYGVGTDRELAEAIGVDPSAVAAWRRRGRVPERHTIKARLAESREITAIASSYDELSVHLLAIFLEIYGNEVNPKPLSFSSDDLNHQFSARIYYEFEAYVRSELKRRRCRSIEQAMTTLEAYRVQFSGRNRLTDLAKFVGL